MRHGVHVGQHDQVLQLDCLFVVQGIEPVIALFQGIRHHLHIHCVNTCVQSWAMRAKECCRFLWIDEHLLLLLLVLLLFHVFHVDNVLLFCCIHRISDVNNRRFLYLLDLIDLVSINWAVSRNPLWNIFELADELDRFQVFIRFVRDIGRLLHADLGVTNSTLLVIFLHLGFSKAGFLNDFCNRLLLLSLFAPLSGNFGIGFYFSRQGRVDPATSRLQHVACGFFGVHEIEISTAVFRFSWRGICDAVLISNLVDFVLGAGTSRDVLCYKFLCNRWVVMIAIKLITFCQAHAIERFLNRDDPTILVIY